MPLFVFSSCSYTRLKKFSDLKPIKSCRAGAALVKTVIAACVRNESQKYKSFGSVYHAAVYKQKHQREKREIIIHISSFFAVLRRHYTICDLIYKYARMYIRSIIIKKALLIKPTGSLPARGNLWKIIF